MPLPPPILSELGRYGGTKRPSVIILDQDGKISEEDQISACVNASETAQNFGLYKDPNDPRHVDSLALAEAEKYKRRVLSYTPPQTFYDRIMREVRNKWARIGEQEPHWVATLRNEMKTATDNIVEVMRTKFDGIIEVLSRIIDTLDRIEETLKQTNGQVKS